MKIEWFRENPPVSGRYLVYDKVYGKNIAWFKGMRVTNFSDPSEVVISGGHPEFPDWEGIWDCNQENIILFSHRLGAPVCWAYLYQISDPDT